MKVVAQKQKGNMQWQQWYFVSSGLTCNLKHEKNVTIKNVSAKMTSSSEESKLHQVQMLTIKIITIIISSNYYVC